MDDDKNPKPVEQPTPQRAPADDDSGNHGNPPPPPGKQKP